MAKKNLLLVDSDPKSLRVMEVSLRKTGFSVTTAINGADGIEKVKISAPDLILSDTKMPEMDGFQFCRHLKDDSKLSTVPFIFLTSEKSVDSKIKGLELGVDDYLTKPIYIKEIVTRIKILLEKKEKESLERRDPRSKFAGDLADMGVVDLIQTIEIGRKTGIIHFSRGGSEVGRVYFRNGKVIDAELGRLTGERAVYRLMVWNEGTFVIEFVAIDRADVIELSSQGLLMEGMRRVDEWGRLLEQLPPLETRFVVDHAELSERLAEIPDEVNGILKLFDARRTLFEVVESSDFGDLEAMNIISKLYFEGLIFDVSTREPEEKIAEADKPEVVEATDRDEAAGSEMVPASTPTSTPVPQIVAPSVPEEAPAPEPAAPPAPAPVAVTTSPSAPVVVTASPPTPVVVTASAPAPAPEGPPATAKPRVVLGAAASAPWPYAFQGWTGPASSASAPSVGPTSTQPAAMPTPTPAAPLAAASSAPAEAPAIVPVPKPIPAPLTPLAKIAPVGRELGEASRPSAAGPPPQAATSPMALPRPTTPSGAGDRWPSNSPEIQRFNPAAVVPGAPVPGGVLSRPESDKRPPLIPNSEAYRPTPAPQSPEEAFGLKSSGAVDQDYLDELELPKRRSGLWVGLGIAGLAAAAVVVFVVTRSPSPAGPTPVAPPTASVSPPPNSSPAAGSTAFVGTRDLAPPPIAVPEPTPKPAEPPRVVTPTIASPASEAPAPEPPAKTKAAVPPRVKPAEPTAKPAQAPGADGDDKDVNKILAKATALYHKGAFKLAIVEYKKALAADDTNDKIHTGLGTAYFDTDQNTLAIQHLKRALELNAKNGQALVILGNVYQAMGDNAKAKQSYESYLKVEPSGKFANDVRLILQAL
jgi:CheY-like chemotaxis protein